MKIITKLLILTILFNKIEIIASEKVTEDKVAENKVNEDKVAEEQVNKIKINIFNTNNVLEDIIEEKQFEEKRACNKNKPYSKINSRISKRNKSSLDNIENFRFKKNELAHEVVNNINHKKITI